MKIAQISPLFEAVPPRLYGGTERVVAQLCEALVDLGHDVTLFSSADARTRAKLAPMRDQAIRLDPEPLKSDVGAHLTMLSEVYARRESFDVLHFHTDMLHFPFFETIPEKTITTLHGRLDLKDLPGVYRRWPEFPLISISDAQRVHLPSANWAGTIHHGMKADPTTWYHAEPRPGYLAFLGRMSPEKAPVQAIAIAKRLGLPLKMAAKVDLRDAAYFQEVVVPHLNDPLVEYVGEISESQKPEFLGNACALLFPIVWPEPFGLVMIEAMACGTPVLAFSAGSAPEVVDDGVTGLLVEDADEAVRRFPELLALRRLDVRRRFERRFTATAMAKRYLDVYAKRLVRETPVRRPIADETSVATSRDAA
ncbi:MAG TPA: glycosyltransferase family 4 protein [Caulobacteraceae bacterium]|nr:glycosyltransferase family 4 protein [Caulobacteraceae bacterium]